MPDDGLPNVICNQCREHLQFVAEFKERCVKVNNTLRELIHGQNMSEIKIDNHSLQISCNELECGYKTTVYDDYVHHCALHYSKNDLNESYCAAEVLQSPQLTDYSIDYDELKELLNERAPDNVTEIKTAHGKVSTFSECIDLTEEATACCICGRQFRNKIELSLHFLKHALLERSLKNQNTDNLFFCKYCGEVCHEKSELEEHCRRLHAPQEESQWKCRLCGQTFEDDINVLLHERTENHFEIVATGNSVLNCLFCPEQYENANTLLLHSVSHLTQKYDCKECKKQFISEDSLEKHLEGHTDFVVMCNICKEFFIHKSILNKHLLTAHGNQTESNYDTNNINNLSIGAISGITNEKSSCNQTTFPCTVCCESFTLKNDLDQHMFSKHNHMTKPDNLNTTHRVEGPYKCPYANCHRNFISAGNLTNHIRSHSRLDDCACKTCGKTFSDAAKLKIHMSVHTKKQPLCCFVCNQQFKTKGHLRIHVTSKHKSDLKLPVKKYKCEVCEREFLKSSNLYSHMRVHNAERQRFSCTVCNLKFVEKRNLATHIASMHSSNNS